MPFTDQGGSEGTPTSPAGVEAVSRVGRGAPGELNHHVDGSPGPPTTCTYRMGLTAENVAERCKVSREAQDEGRCLQTRAVGRGVTGTSSRRSCR